MLHYPGSTCTRLGVKVYRMTEGRLTMRMCRRAALACAMILIVAWVVNGTTLEAALLLQGHEPLPYLTKTVVQIFLALLAARLIDLVVSSAGSLLLWRRQRRGPPHPERVWRYSTPKGMIVGIIVVGVFLGWAPKDVYRHPEDQRRFELHRSSLLENPLGFPPGSRGTTRLVVMHATKEGRRVSQSGFEFTDLTAAERAAGRTVLWSAGGEERSVLKLAGGECLFFPRPFGGYDSFPCPSEEVIETFLGGETLDYVNLMMMDENP